jgi:DNA-cytosine methyltransferase
MMNNGQNSALLNVVDLFCGGGGLSCGFELHRGRLQYRTILGIDTDPAAIRIFNANVHSPASATTGSLPIGRRADVTWFVHPVEIRLFYLVHLALAHGDDLLASALGDVGLAEFLSALKRTDQQFSESAAAVGESDPYREALSEISPQTFSLALPQVVLDSLGLASLAKPAPSYGHLPWTQEYELLRSGDVSPGVSIDPDPALVRDCRQVWSAKTNLLREASVKTGRGQHKNNASRLKTLAAFLESKPAQDLRSAWISWRSRRETIRAHFCLENAATIDGLYSGNRRVHIVLGGPPCKGFSRIGRPVIVALRDQGVHAWSHKEYGDERNSLMCQYVLFLEALQPDVFLFENVSNFQSTLKTPNGELDAPALLEELIDDLSEGHLHYHIHYQLLNARHFAVPQDRRRFIMFGVNAAKAELGACRQFFAFKSTREDVPLSVALLGLGTPGVFSPGEGVKSDHCAPVYRFFDDTLPSGTRTYLAWVQQPDPRTGEPTRTTTAHIYRQCRDDDRAFIEFVGPGIRWMDLKTSQSPTVDELKAVLVAASRGAPSELARRIKDLLPKVDDSLMLRLLLEHTQARRNLTEQHLLLEGYLRNGGSTHGDWLERLSATKPCKTIVAHIGKDTYGYWHPTEPRALTIREAARVQSFPDFFRLDVAGVVDTYTVIGNAVPPLLSSEFARRIEELAKEWAIFGDATLDPTLQLVRRKAVRQLQLSM